MAGRQSSRWLRARPRPCVKRLERVLKLRIHDKQAFNRGSEPDPRFTFANERTFLAWNRTALAFMAAGLAVAQFVDVAGRLVQVLLTVALIVIGGGIALGSYSRWRDNEVAMRAGQPLPQSHAPAYVTGALAFLGTFAVVAAIVERLL
ncbi:MAG: DUF202 domain-containing protein [Actinobacteria bacterium]|nr:DUF202 domain-containing protein [Actinomycetota bacterium]